MAGAAGALAVCAVSAEGCLTCDVVTPDDSIWATGYWVDHGEGQIPDGTFQAVSASQGTAAADGDTYDWELPQHGMCALTVDGTPSCWGQPFDDPSAYTTWVDAPQGALDKLVMGNTHACGLDENGFAFCWGDCSGGGCGVPSGPFLDIVAGDEFSCGLVAGGDVECWGWDDKVNDLCNPYAGAIPASRGRARREKVSGVRRS